MNLKRFIWLGLLLLFFTGCGTSSQDPTKLDTTNGDKEDQTEEVSSRFPDNPNKDLTFDFSKLEDIWLAGGCFWGVEAYMSRVYGVYNVTSGYANGDTVNPTYEDVVLMDTGHAETVHVRYDPERVDLETLLTHFFMIIDPTSVNQQGNDKGEQYRTAIYYENPAEKEVIERVLANEQVKYDDPIVTEVEPLENYYLAEDYHQDYLEKNPNAYCHIDFDPLEDQDIPEDEAA